MKLSEILHKLLFNYMEQNNNNNNKHFFNLQVANSPSRLRFEANLSRKSSECTEHSRDQMSQNEYRENSLCGKCLIKEICFKAFSKR